MLNYRRLGIEDGPALIKIIEERPEVFMGHRDDEYKKELIHYIPKILNDPLWFVPGFFDGEQLIGCIVYEEWVDQPCIYLHYTVIKQADYSHLHTRESVATVKSFEHWCLDYIEVERGINRMYLVYRVDEGDQGIRGTAMSNRLLSYLQRRGASRMNEYDWYVDCEIPLDTRPKYPYQQYMLAYKKWPFPTRIELGIKRSTRK